MKRWFSRLMAVAVELWTALAACPGCQRPQPKPERPAPPVVLWQGEDTGYRSITPATAAAGDEKPDAAERRSHH